MRVKEDIIGRMFRQIFTGDGRKYSPRCRGRRLLYFPVCTESSLLQDVVTVNELLKYDNEE